MIGERQVLIFEVGPAIRDCMGVAPMKCLEVNGELFYDHIRGFKHRPGVTSIIEVEREQYCDPSLPNSCPQDVGIYRYKLLRVLEEK